MTWLAKPAACVAFLAFAGFLFLAPDVAKADDDDERARAALRAGDVVPLVQVLSKVESLYEGDVLEVELEDEDDDRRDGGTSAGFVYEIKLLTPQGNVLKLELDAKTLEVLKVKGRGAERARRR
jgi:uncharacterized membrane protein YkoI